MEHIKHANQIVPFILIIEKKKPAIIQIVFDTIEKEILTGNGTVKFVNNAGDFLFESVE